MGIRQWLQSGTPPTPKPAIAAAAAGNPLVGNFINYTTDNARSAAMNLPTISRARDLICSMVGCLTMKQYTMQFNGDEMERIYLPPDTWFQQPDPNTTRNFMLSWTTDDLLFYGRAFWIITSRFGNGFPATFTWIPAADVQTLDQSGPQWWGPSKQILFQGLKLNHEDVVQFLSPIQGLIYTGIRAATIAQRLDTSAERFAKTQMAPVTLKQTGGEPMSPQDLADLAAAYAEAREANAVSALNEYVDVKESQLDPNKMQLTEARTYQALELARVANIPPYLVGAPTGSGMTYQNAQQARQDLYLFGAKPYIDCIEQTLSMNSILPRGRYLELDVESYLEENNMGGGVEEHAASETPSPTLAD